MRKNSGLMQSIFMTGGNLVAVTFSAVSLILISRLLGPEKFGVFGVGFSLSQILASIGTLGMSLAQMKYVPKEDSQKVIGRIFSYAIRLRIIAYLVIALFGLLLGKFISNLLNFSQPIVIYIAFFSVIATLAYDQIITMLQSLRLVGRSAMAAIMQGIVKMILSIFLFTIRSPSAVLAFTFFIFSPLITLLPGKKWFPSWLAININADFTQEKKLLTTIAKHGLVYYISLSLIDNLDILLVQRYLTEFDTGLFSGVARIALLFATVSYSIAAVINPRVARYVQQKDLGAYLRKAGLLSLLLLFSLVILLPLSHYLIRFTIGPDYLQADLAMKLLMIAGVLTMISTLFMAMFYSFKGMDSYFSVAGILQLVVMLGGDLILIPLYGISGAALTRIISKVVLLVVTMIWGGYHYYQLYKVQS
jgi:stage V sporulation protein B